VSLDMLTFLDDFCCLFLCHWFAYFFFDEIFSLLVSSEIESREDCCCVEQVTRTDTLMRSFRLISWWFQSWNRRLNKVIRQWLRISWVVWLLLNRGFRDRNEDSSIGICVPWTLRGCSAHYTRSGPRLDLSAVCWSWPLHHCNAAVRAVL